MTLAFSFHNDAFHVCYLCTSTFKVIGGFRSSIFFWKGNQHSDIYKYLVVEAVRWHEMSNGRMPSKIMITSAGLRCGDWSGYLQQWPFGEKKMKLQDCLAWCNYHPEHSSAEIDVSNNWSVRKNAVWFNYIEDLRTYKLVDPVKSPPCRWGGRQIFLLRNKLGINLHQIMWKLPEKNSKNVASAGW